MQSFIQLIIILAVLTTFGIAKLDSEDQLHRDMVEQRLLHPPIQHETLGQLGQAGAAASLGGMRSLIATVWNLRAFLHFEDLDWIKVEHAYNIITTLQPQTIHYWKTGAWHLHTNAAVYYNEDPDLPSFRQSALQREYIHKGSAMLEQGVKQNPDSWELHSTLAQMWTDSYKTPDLPRAIAHYKDTLACKSLPDYKRAMFERFHFYAMTRVPAQRPKAYREGLRLYHASPRNRTPSLRNYLFALQNELAIAEPDRIPESELFPDHATQLRWLKNLWKRKDQDYPVSGVRAKIEALERESNRYRTPPQTPPNSAKPPPSIKQPFEP